MSKSSLSPISRTVRPEKPTPWYMIFLLRVLSLFPRVTIMRGPGQPYLTRWCLLGGSPYDSRHPFLPFNLFLHCFHSSDSMVPHNHPWRWSRSLILSGRYREDRLLNAPSLLVNTMIGGLIDWRVLKPGMINRLDDSTFHRVELLTPEVWTLFLCGRKTQRWGFLVRDEAGARFEFATDYLSKIPGATSNERVIDG